MRLNPETSELSRRTRLKLREFLARHYAPLRRNSKPAPDAGRFKFIARFRKYTRAYHSKIISWTGVIGVLHAPHISHHNWFAGSSYARPSKVRRFLVARIKRIAAETAAIESAWISRGSRVFIFKKGQNSRMGKGCGSFHSSRRQVVGGSLLARVSTSASFVIKNINNYIRARWGSSVIGAKFTNDLRVAPSMIEALTIADGAFTLRLRQKFRRRRAIWSLLRRRSMRRVATSLYGARSSYRPSALVWRWSRAAFSSRRVYRPKYALARALRARRGSAFSSLDGKC